MFCCCFLFNPSSTQIISFSYSFSFGLLFFILIHSWHVWVSAGIFFNSEIEFVTTSIFLTNQYLKVLITFMSTTQNFFTIFVRSRLGIFPLRWLRSHPIKWSSRFDNILDICLVFLWILYQMSAPQKKISAVFVRSLTAKQNRNNYFSLQHEIENGPKN